MHHVSYILDTICHHMNLSHSECRHFWHSCQLFFLQEIIHQHVGKVESYIEKWNHSLSDLNISTHLHKVKLFSSCLYHCCYWVKCSYLRPKFVYCCNYSLHPFLMFVFAYEVTRLTCFSIFYCPVPTKWPEVSARSITAHHQ